MHYVIFCYPDFVVMFNRKLVNEKLLYFSSRMHKKYIKFCVSVFFQQQMLFLSHPLLEESYPTPEI